MPARILFMGTPEFAVASLRLLHGSGCTLAGVVTVPDRPSGRGQRVVVSPVKEYALSAGLTLLQPDQLRDPLFIESVRSIRPDLIVVVAFRILPPEVFTIPRLGSFNLHASLLPKYRGAAPIQWAIIRGERETGVTTFFLREAVDTGNIILQARTPIGENETAGELHDRLAAIGAEVVLHTVRLIELGRAVPHPQDDGLASAAPKIFREACVIDWRRSSVELHNFIRGVSPVPAATTTHRGETMKIYRGAPARESGDRAPGTVLVSDRRLVVQTGDGGYEILQLQRSGGKQLSAEEFLRGYSCSVGDHFG